MQRLNWPGLLDGRHGYRVRIGITITLCCCVPLAWADETPPTEGRVNLASGRPVVFSPAPNYGLTAKGDSDETDLTDGKTTAREDRRIWFESGAVGWSYGGRVNLAVDLGTQASIDEISIRLLGGSPQAGVNFPVWIEAFTSDDGEHWRSVGQCSRWNKGDFDRFAVPRDQGQTWIHCLRFCDLNAGGRWVGLRVYACGLSCCDELYVFGSAGKGTTAASGAPADFTVTRPQPYLHKPYAVLATNIATPLPVGLVVPPDWTADAPLRLTVEMPSGVELLGGGIGGQAFDQATIAAQSSGVQSYLFEIARPKTTKVLGRLYAQASGWRDGQAGRLRYHFSQGSWKSPVVSVPLSAVEVRKAPRLERIMVGLGWWSAADSAKWPRVLDAWEQLGLNSFPLFAHWMKQGDPLWDLAEEARRRGFFIVNIDSPLHRMMTAHKNDAVIYDQLADGAPGKQLCISYRGSHYQREIERFAESMARARPHFASADIEIWGWRGPTDSQKCSRCQADFKASGREDWAEWQLAKGDEIWRELAGAARAAVADVGGPACRFGGYDFRPGPAYQSVWSVDRNYPDWMHGSQVSTDSCLYPYHWQLIGDEVRRDRDALGGNDVMPWITPGDAGTFPGEALQWTLLECYCNGARGVYFWSGRVWDAESLIAYNRVVRAIAPVERLILEGEPLGEFCTVDEPGRLSGLRLDTSALLLVADYQGQSQGTVTLNLHLPVRSRLVDLLSGEVLAADLPHGRQQFPVLLGGSRARLLHVTTVQSGGSERQRTRTE